MASLSPMKRRRAGESEEASGEVSGSVGDDDELMMSKVSML